MDGLLGEWGNGIIIDSYYGLPSGKHTMSIAKSNDKSH
jgi:hypothetical protein